MAAAQKKMPTRNLETIIRAGVGPRAMPPDTVQVFKIADDVFSWEVSFWTPNSGSFLFKTEESGVM